jgi:hypothetical protein
MCIPSCTFLRGSAHDTCIHPGGWHFVLLERVFLPVSMASSLPSSLVFTLPPSSFSSHSLLRAAQLECHGPFVGTSPSACFHEWRPLLDSSSFPGGCKRSRFGLTGGHGTRPCKAIHYFQGSFQTHRQNMPHQASVHHCCPSYMRINMVTPQGAIMALLFPVVAQGASGPLLQWGLTGRRVPR